MAQHARPTLAAGTSLSQGVTALCQRGSQPGLGEGSPDGLEALRSEFLEAWYSRAGRPHRRSLSLWKSGVSGRWSPGMSSSAVTVCRPGNGD